MSKGKCYLRFIFQYVLQTCKYIIYQHTYKIQIYCTSKITVHIFDENSLAIRLWSHRSILYTVFAIRCTICSLLQTTFKWCSVEAAESGLWQRANRIGNTVYSYLITALGQPFWKVWGMDDVVTVVMFQVTELFICFSFSEFPLRGTNSEYFDSNLFLFLVWNNLINDKGCMTSSVPNLCNEPSVFKNCTLHG